MLGFDITKKSRFLDNLYWTYPTFYPPLQKSIALLELQYFSADGSSVCESRARCLMAVIHSKVDIFPFYLLPVIQN